MPDRVARSSVPGMSKRALSELASLAAIVERREAMTAHEAVTGARAAWGLGDYHRFAKCVRLGGRAGARRGLRRRAGPGSLDVAAGTGNVAIRAAEAGGNVVASDLTPRTSTPDGTRRGCTGSSSSGWKPTPRRCRSPTITSTSSPRASGRCSHRADQAVADELVRVCKRGGTIGMANFTPDSLLPAFFAVFAPYMPPPAPGAQPPVLWGTEEHLRPCSATVSTRWS